MLGRVEPEQLKSDLILPWVIQGIMLATLAAYSYRLYNFRRPDTTAPAGSSASAD